MRCWKENARREFDAWSIHYDRSLLQRLFFRPTHEKVLSVLSTAGVAPAARILDIGCGTGLFMRRLLEADPACHVTGLDLSEQMLARARHCCRELPPQQAARTHLVQADAEYLPFDDGEFDVITCNHSFHHYPHQGKVLREMNRVLAPGGQLLIVDGDRDRPWGWLVFDIGVTTMEGLVHHCSATQLRGIFEAAGFQDIEQHRVGGIAPFLLTRGITSKAGVSKQPAIRAA